MSSEARNNASVVALYVFSGPHLGARLELEEGSWLLGADDSCDIILSELAARHAVLDISVGKSPGDITVLLSPLDGSVRLRGEKEIFPPEPGEQSPRLAPGAGSGWYLGRTCFAWNLPDVEQPPLEPEEEVRSISSAVMEEGGRHVSSTSNEVAAPDSPVATEDANTLSASPAAVSSEMPLSATRPKKSGLRARFILLALLAVLLTAMSVALTPPTPTPLQYPVIVEQYLAEADIPGLTVTPRDPGVEVRGSVADDAAMIRLRDMARTLQFPVYLEVGVREDILRAVRSSLGIRGFHPEVTITENDASPRLIVAAYMKDKVLEAAAFSALESEVRGLPPEERRIVHEEELAPVLEEALKEAGLASVRAVYLPGRVDFAGDFRPEDAPTLLAVRREVGEHFGVPLYGSSVVTPSTLPSAVQPSETGRTLSAEEGTDSSTAPSRPLLAAAKTDDGGDTDPLGGLRVTGVTMSPMRFVTTSDGRRLFEGAVLPGGYTLESISTKVLILRRGERIFTYRLRGSQ